MFEYVFLLDPSLKSIFAQKQSCRPSLPLQLPFWPNFMLPYEILSSNMSKSSKIWSKSCTVPPLCSTLCRPGAHNATGDAPAMPRVGRREERRLASKLRRSPRRPSPFSFTPLLPARAQTEPSPCSAPPLAAPAIALRPLSIKRAPASLALPRTCPAPPRDRLSCSSAKSRPPLMSPPKLRPRHRTPFSSRPPLNSSPR